MEPKWFDHGGCPGNQAVKRVSVCLSVRLSWQPINSVEAMKTPRTKPRLVWKTSAAPAHQSLLSFINSVTAVRPNAKVRRGKRFFSRRTLCKHGQTFGRHTAAFTETSPKTKTQDRKTTELTPIKQVVKVIYTSLVNKQVAQNNKTHKYSNLKNQR